MNDYAGLGKTMVGDKVTVYVSGKYGLSRHSNLVAIETVIRTTSTRIITESGAWARVNGNPVDAKGARTVHKIRPREAGDEAAMERAALLDAAGSVLSLRSDELRALPNDVLMRVRDLGAEIRAILMNKEGG